VNKPVIVDDQTAAQPLPGAAAQGVSAGPVYVVLGGISVSHFLNDTMQSLIPSIYPILKENYALDFTQIGLITLTFQITASLLQPVVGALTDRKPQPFSLAIGMGSTFMGVAVWSPMLCVILLAAGWSVRARRFSTRILALPGSLGRPYGFAQSVFGRR